MTHLFIIRHAQAQSQVNPVAAGPKGDTGLTPLGIEQAEKLRDRLQRTQEIKPDLVVSSDLPRAKQTAEIVASVWDLPIILDKELREVSAGEADGLPLGEIRHLYNLDAFLSDRLHTLASGGENHAEFTIRACFALQRIIRLCPNKTIVIFAHGSILDASFYLFLNISPFTMLPISFSMQNTAITWWEQVEANFFHPPQWRLNRHNDASHLTP